MIYTDGVHLVTDGPVEELHSFATRLQLKRWRFHGSRRGHPHYDLSLEASMWSERYGAVLVSPKEVIKAIRRMPQ